MKNTIFETKEQYLQMRKDWAEYFNTEARNLERNEYGNKIKKLKHAHFLIYAALRNKDFRTLLHNSSIETRQEAQFYLSNGPRYLSVPFPSLSAEQMKTVSQYIKERI